MAQVINTNIASLFAQKNLNITNSSLNTALQRLSSGKRINSAKDDAAGIAIASRFTAQIKGTNQGARNSADAISLAQTTEGSLDEISSNLQRIRELAVQSANATNSDTDRQALQAEVDELTQEISRIVGSASFNGTKLFTSGDELTFQVGAGSSDNDKISVTLPDLTAGGITTTTDDYTASQITSATIMSSTFESLKSLPAHIIMHEGFLHDHVANSFEEIIIAEGGNIMELTYVDPAPDGTGGSFSISATLASDPEIAAAFDVSKAVFDYYTANGGEIGGVTGQDLVDTAAAKAAEMDAATTTTTVGGALNAYTGDINAVKTIDISTASAASTAISDMDDDLKLINTNRATFGAVENRFESVIRNAENLSENLSASRSRIEDADFAVETANLTKFQILQQAGTSVLSQANALPQSVLSLLG